MSSVIGNPLLLSPEGYQISRSVRLRSSASAYLNRTPASVGNRKTWTWSGWVKRGTLGAVSRSLINAYSSGSVRFFTGFGSDDKLSFYADAGAVNVTTTAVFRDPSAYYHVVLLFDTTQATAANRCRIFVNGLEQTVSGAFPNQNTDWQINNNVGHFIGQTGGSADYFDGYLTEINFIDGQALTPSSFGENDVVTGVWKPKKYNGTYGTNGFYLNFSDNSSNTATTIGKDYSGNGNNWTPNNISVTTGATYDSLLDVPTPWADGGNGRGNYCTLNPLDNSQGAGVIADGNLKISYSASGRGLGTIFSDSGKWYAEFTAGQVSTATNADAVGVCGVGTTSSVLRAYAPNGQYYNGSAWASYGATYTTGDVIGVAVDVGNQTIEFFKNNASQGQRTSIGLSLLAFVAWAQGTTGNNIAANFGQRPFSYTPPTGFKALNTQNLPDATIKKGNQYFDVDTYTGNGGTLARSGFGFQPDFIWSKPRSIANDHQLFDSVRGNTKILYSDLTNAENTVSGVLNSFDASGYTVGSSVSINQNAATYVSWLWKAGGTAVSNTAGSITAQVSANPTAGFSVVTYTGTGANATVGHGLGVAPKMVIVKVRGQADNWSVYHASLGATIGLQLNTTAASNTNAGFWNNASPTSTVFTVGTFNSKVSDNHVAYCFAEVPGFSKFGSYTGNGSTDGPFVYCGFRPRFILFKNASDGTANSGWVMMDTARDTYNVMPDYLQAQSSAAEASSSGVNLDVVANGFKIRNTSTAMNASTNTIIFVAFAENPFKNALAR